MFEHAEQDPTLDPEEFDRIEDELRTALVLAQYERLKRADRALLIVVAGPDGAGKGSTINLLNEWLDPRHVHVMAFGEPTPEQAARPPMWRYWHGLPARGETGVVFGSWYQPLLTAAERGDDGTLREGLAAANRFEALLAADGVRILKLWFHLSREAQRQRCERLLADPDTAWRVSAEDLAVLERFDTLAAAGARVIEATDTAAAPWHVVPSADENLRIVTAARRVLAALEGEAAPAIERPSRSPTPEPTTNRFDGLDFGARLGKAEYASQIAHWQGRLARAVRRDAFRERSLVLVFEGDDAAGKGGAIRRVTHALDVRQYELIPVAAPNDEARARPYLWRFWERVPARGRIAIFDRSWYGRVLVERVEGLATEADWRRAYDEIVEFERQLVRHGAVLLKFWLAISKDEQLARFRAREQTPFKSFKITEEDWRNRERWDDYKLAASQMLARTQSPEAPWTLVASDDKRFARLMVLRTIAEAVEAAIL